MPDSCVLLTRVAFGPSVVRHEWRYSVQAGVVLRQACHGLRVAEKGTFMGVDCVLTMLGTKSVQLGRRLRKG